MRIALDAMGGDFAPGPNIVGAIEAVERNPKLEILLVGDRARLDDEKFGCTIGAGLRRCAGSVLDL